MLGGFFVQGLLSQIFFLLWLLVIIDDYQGMIGDVSRKITNFPEFLSGWNFLLFGFWFKHFLLQVFIYDIVFCFIRDLNIRQGLTLQLNLQGSFRAFDQNIGVE